MVLRSLLKSSCIYEEHLHYIRRYPRSDITLSRTRCGMAIGSTSAQLSRKELRFSLTNVVLGMIMDEIFKSFPSSYIHCVRQGCIGSCQTRNEGPETTIHELSLCLHRTRPSHWPPEALHSSRSGRSLEIMGLARETAGTFKIFQWVQRSRNGNGPR